MPPERAVFFVTPERGDTLFAPEGRNAAPEARDLTASGGCGRLFMPGGHNTAPEGRGALCRGGRLCAAVRGAGALRMRHTPCGCCPPTRAKGAELPFVFTAVPLSLRDRNCRSAGILFSVLPEKSMQKRGARREITLTRRKTSRSVLRVIVTPAVKERPSGDRQIGFPERTINYMSRYVSAR